MLNASSEADKSPVNSAKGKRKSKQPAPQQQQAESSSESESNTSGFQPKIYNREDL